ncbi:MAG: iron transporter [Actinomycetaceae bacterium]|nr:iron transporter [Actinomycetaceae bacterium]
MTLKRKGIALLAAGILAATSLAGCTSNEGGDNAKTDDTKKAEEPAGDAGAEEELPEGAVKVNNPEGKPDACGLQEQEGPQDYQFGPFVGNIMFFQPGQMSDNPNSDMKMADYKDSQMHLELDLKANAYATNYGYSVDETPANLHIMYLLTKEDGSEVDSGMMMPMNAIDGSHYGTNLKKDTITEPGKYKMKITIFPPKNYDLHSDYITGVPVSEWFKPLTVEKDWEISQENLDKVKANTVEDFMNPPAECKDFPKTKFEDPEAEKALKDAEAAEPLKMTM